VVLGALTNTAMVKTTTMEIAGLTITIAVISQRKIIRMINVMTTMHKIIPMAIMKTEETIIKLKHSEEERKVFPDRDQDHQRRITLTTETHRIIEVVVEAIKSKQTEKGREVNLNLTTDVIL
jgi:hypothetical protein